MSASMYNRSIRSRNVAAMLLAIMLCLAAYKGYNSWMKTKLYAEAASLQAAGSDLEAEEAYTKAQSINSINYKESETAEALSALRPVTELKRYFGALEADLAAAEGANDINLLLKSYEAFQTKVAEIASQDEAAKKRFADMASTNKIDERFTEVFTNSKQTLIQSLEADISKKTFDSDNAIIYLLQLPAAYFTDEKNKKQQLSKLLERYDQARLDVVFKNKAYEDVLKDAVRIRKFYDSNGVDAPWLLPKVEAYAQSELAKLLTKNDLPGFISKARTYQAYKELGGSSSKVLAYVQTNIRKQFDRADQLITSRKFADAIALYNVLDKYQDTQKEVSSTEQLWLETDPLQLLRKAAGNEVKFTNVISAKSTGGTKLLAAGLVDNKAIVMARLLTDQKIETAQAELDKGLTIKTIQWSEQLGDAKPDTPALLIEAASKNRKARYIAYEVKSTQMRKILDIEADKMDIDRSGTLVLDNPAGEGAGRKAYYEYRDNRYVFAKTNVDFIEIPLAELTSHKNEKVRFQVTITSVEDNKATVQLSNGYITLNGKFKFKTGPATITGTYTGLEEVRKAPSQLYEYKVTVTDIAQ
ncbi:hypothetical protein GC093_25035 [Paenibacillus sp. LMG 31456]|uniref:Uncharacterized protein n=1 Tax=Paenibacillus foliorum TaxID=2654974 RepID=A0A972K272_9BACL|nr:hypothetical protein [Paenibacillus foliorum]NOU96456.1 hypothetical protein [Paenibacillus foliorum]